MVMIRRKATSKASLVRSLRANNVKYSNLRTIKRASKKKVGVYALRVKVRR